MPSLKKLNEETFPLVLIDGDDPFIAQMRKNCRNRHSQIQLDAVLKEIGKEFEKAQAKVKKLSDEGAALDRTEVIEAKEAEIAAIEGSELSEDTLKLSALNEELAALKAEQLTNADRLHDVAEAINKQLTELEEWSRKSLAKQLVFFFTETNMRETDEPDSPIIPSSIEFWSDNFDRETLADFADKVTESLSGPLGMRGSSTA